MEDWRLGECLSLVSESNTLEKRKETVDELSLKC